MERASLVAVLVLCTPAIGGTFDSGSDGSDGAFMPGGDVVIDLGLASPGSWDTPGNGNGVYDADRWIVVFKFTTIDIPFGVNITFANHPSHAPVVWLAQGDVVIDGTVSLNGEAGMFSDVPYVFSEPGPGGFHGGSADILDFNGSSGFGPGGGFGSGAPGRYDYGNESIFPLIGGSGGAYGPNPNNSGGAGGGAILIASSGTTTHNGVIAANGGDQFLFSGAGSGGGIRLIANTILGDGVLTAQGLGPGDFDNGRIRLEAFDVSSFSGTSDPAATIGGPGPVVQDNTVPTIRLAMIDGQPVPQDPIAGVLTKEVVTDSGVVTLTIEATNIPPGTTVTVYIRPAHDHVITATSTPLVGNMAFSTATATVGLPIFPADIQLRATF